MQVVGPYTSPTLFSENPGRVYIQNLTPTIVGTPGFVDIAGTRTWGIGSRTGDYLSRASVGQDRESVTWLFEIDTSRIKNTSTTIAPNTDYEPLIGSFRQDLVNRANWFLFCWRNPNGMNVGMMDSLDSASPPFHFINGTSTLWTINEKRKYALTKASDGSVKLYTASRATATTATRNSVGSMGGSEVLAFNAGPLAQCAKISRVVSDAELDAWFADGTIPASDVEFAYLGGHEIVESAPKIWDSGPNAYDLTATQITNWQSPSMRGDYTDDPGNPVVPFTIFSVYPLANGDASLRFVRERQGVPSRATDEERFETYDWNFTVSDAPSTEQTVVSLFIYADREGTANISCDVTGIIDFPASVGVVAGSTIVQGTIVGAGTVNVTVELNGETSVTPFTIEAITPTVSVGPIQNVRSRLP